MNGLREPAISCHRLIRRDSRGMLRLRLVNSTEPNWKAVACLRGNDERLDEWKRSHTPIKQENRDSPTPLKLCLALPFPIRAS
jgi:hypothetical protein